MDVRKRVVTRRPLLELWDGDGVVQATRGHQVGREAIRALLREGDLQFVLADVGLAPKWISGSDTYRFWKDEVHDHVVDGHSARLPSGPASTCASVDGHASRVPTPVRSSRAA